MVNKKAFKYASKKTVEGMKGLLKILFIFMTPLLLGRVLHPLLVIIIYMPWVLFWFGYFLQDSLDNYRCEE